MGNGVKTGGRKAGTPNKLSSNAKDTVSQCAAMLEANGRTLLAWVQKDEKNEYAFWTSIYPKLLPLQLTGEGGGPVQIIATSLDEKL